MSSKVNSQKSVEIVNREFGPALGSPGAKVDSSKGAAKLVALWFGAGLYRPFAVAPILNCLEKNSIPFHIVGGEEMSALMISLYAHGDSPDTLEWKSYKLHKKLAEDYPFSKEWKSTLEEFVEAEIRGKKIEQSLKTLVLPKVTEQAQESVFRGSNLALIYQNLLLKGNSNKNFPVGRAINLRNLLMARDIDYLIFFDFLDSEIKFRKIDDFLFGQYTKEKSILSRVDWNLWPQVKRISFDFKGTDLDEGQNIQDVLHIARAECENIVKEIKRLIEDVNLHEI